MAEPVKKLDFCAWADARQAYRDGVLYFWSVFEQMTLLPAASALQIWDLRPQLPYEDGIVSAVVFAIQRAVCFPVRDFSQMSRALLVGYWSHWSIDLRITRRSLCTSRTNPTGSKSVSGSGMKLRSTGRRRTRAKFEGS